MRNVDEFTDEVFRRRDVQVVKQKERRQAVHRKVTALVTVLAIVLTVGAVGVAAAVISGADWFAGFYAEKSGERLSDDQVKYLETSAVDVKQSVTSADGFTMTLGAVNGSDNRLDVYLDVVAPEGVSLSDDVNIGIGHYPLSIYKDGQAILLSSVARDYVVDEYPDDNKKTYFFMVHAGELDGKIFSEGGTYSLSISGLHRGLDDEVVSSGSWSFDFKLPKRTESEIQVIMDPIECTTSRWISKQYTGIAKLESFTLYAMTGNGSFRIVDREYGKEFGKDDDFHIHVTVVLNDGSMVNERGGWSKDPNTGLYEFQVDLYAPIVLSEVDYVVFGGYEDENGNWVEGTRVDIP